MNGFELGFASAVGLALVTYIFWPQIWMAVLSVVNTVKRKAGR